MKLTTAPIVVQLTALIHDQHPRVSEHSTRETQQLALADRERIAPLADIRVQRLRQRLDGILQLRALQSVPQPGVVVLSERVCATAS